LIHINEVLLFRVLFHADATVSERIMAQTTLTYLEQRYAALETEIAYALVQRPTDDLVIADLTYRKLIIADEIQHNRRLVERFACASLRVRQRRCPSPMPRLTAFCRKDPSDRFMDLAIFFTGVLAFE
jgi:hypothetical protein